MKKTNNLQSWLTWLSQFRLIPGDRQASVQDLQHSREVAADLNLNAFTCPVITVGGTNGKGSCVATLESLYLTSGYQVAAITSPHLFIFNERLRYQGKPVDDKTLSHSFFVIYSAAKKLKVQLSFFRFITLALLWCCRQWPLDVCLLEVGIGGRFDSTNLIDADIAVITSIGLDHCHLLGETREAIAEEKLGILRPGKDFVCGDPLPPANVITSVKAAGANMYQAGKDFECVVEKNKTYWQSKTGRYIIPEHHLCNLNIAAAIMAAECLKSNLNFSQAQLTQAIKTLNLPGRCELHQKHPDDPRLLIDVAHNPSAACYLTGVIDRLAIKGKIYAVFGAMSDKAISEILHAFKAYVDHWFFAPLDTERSWQPQAFLSEVGHVTCCDNVQQAYEVAYKRGQSNDLILCFGSFFVARDALSSFYANEENAR